MILDSLSPLANHLWQSTLCVLAVWLLTLAMKRNRAAIRYGLWLAASLKFLVPFSVLVSAGSQFRGHADAVVSQPQLVHAMDEMALPFFIAAPPPFSGEAPSSSSPMVAILVGLWLCGFAIGVRSWLRGWRRARAALHSGTPLHLDLPVPIISSPARLEPGVFGIFRPVLMVPEGIADYLTPPQLEAILAHELCHVRRRDNLTGALHMIVEAIFWFHPLMGWIRARLVAERERACDEEVLRAAGDPHVYAEGILNVCKFCLKSPIVCMAGVSGSNLKHRIEEIVAYRGAPALNLRRKILLAAAGFAAVGGPLILGLLDAPASLAQSPAGGAKTPAFEAASIKPSKPGGRGRSMLTDPSGRFTAENATARELITFAYNVRAFQVSGGPGWIDADHYDIVAKPEAKAGRGQIYPMAQALLADRFKLNLHRETKDLPVYTLVIAKGGPKFKEAKPDADRPMNGIQGGRGEMTGLGADMGLFARRLAVLTGRTVVDRTGLTGKYDFKLQWTPDTSQGMRSPEEPPSDNTPGPSIFSAIQEQLGLKLEASKGPVEILVIDHIEKPSAN